MIDPYYLKQKAFEYAKKFAFRQQVEPQTAKDAKELHELNEAFY